MCFLIKVCVSIVGGKLGQRGEMEPVGGEEGGGEDEEGSIGIIVANNADILKYHHD